MGFKNHMFTLYAENEPTSNKPVSDLLNFLVSHQDSGIQIYLPERLTDCVLKLRL